MKNSMEKSQILQRFGEISRKSEDFGTQIQKIAPKNYSYDNAKEKENLPTESDRITFRKCIFRLFRDFFSIFVFFSFFCIFVFFSFFDIFVFLYFRVFFVFLYFRVFFVFLVFRVFFVFLYFRVFFVFLIFRVFFVFLLKIPLS